MGNGCMLLPLLALVSVGSALLAHSGSEIGAVWAQAKTGCNGSIGECYPEEEMLADSESNRRILQTRTYISYQALRANSVPCSKKGSSYYNCQSGGQANPYTRSCTQMTRCARDTS